MNIVFTSDLAGLGGGEVGLLYVMEELIKNNHNVSLICRLDGELVRRAKELGVTVYICDFKRNLLKLLKTLEKINKKEKINIVHNNELTTAIIFGILGVVYSYKNVTTCHGQWYELSEIKKKLINKYVKHIYCVSNSVKENLEKQSIKNLSISYLGVPTEKFNKTNKNSKLKKELMINDEIVILTIARYQKIKGQLKGVKAIEKLVKQGFNIRYLLIGDNVFKNSKDEQYKQKVLNYIKNNKLDKYINVLGERSDIPELLSIADIALITSDNESFGVVAIESLAANCVVLSTPCDGIKEILQNDKDMICSSNDSESLTILISNYLTDEEKRKNIKRKIKKYFEKFDIKKVVDHYLQYYK